MAKTKVTTDHGPFTKHKSWKVINSAGWAMLKIFRISPLYGNNHAVAAHVHTPNGREDYRIVQCFPPAGGDPKVLQPTGRCLIFGSEKALMDFLNGKPSTTTTKKKAVKRTANKVAKKKVAKKKVAKRKTRK